MVDSPHLENHKEEEEDDFSFEDFKATQEDAEESDDDSCPIVKVTKDEVKEWFKPWCKALVIKLIGKKLGQSIIVEQVKYLWKVKGDLFVTDIGNGYLVIRFTNGLDYETTLLGGPWLISYHYLLVQKYSPYFDPNTNEITKMSVWI